jgi:molybdenum-dependent DNA-binding transcriptional regulator ModE
VEKTFINNLSDIQFLYKIWLSNKDNKGILGDGKWQILKMIENKGSIKAACNEFGYTYCRTLDNLKKIERFLRDLWD